MAEYFSSLEDRAVLGLTLTRPLYGRWTADVVLERPADNLGGQMILKLGALEMLCTPWRAGNFQGVSQLRVRGGYGGWGREVPAKLYRVPGGVRLAMVAGDAAREAGELLEVGTELARTTVGPFFNRMRAPASRVFGQMGEPRWWVREEGVTVVGPRTDPFVTSRYDVLIPGTDLGRGRISIATDYPEDWPPGCRFQAPGLDVQRASAVVHTLTGDSLRTIVWTTP